MAFKLLTALVTFVLVSSINTGLAMADAALDAAACDALAASPKDTEKPSNVPGVPFDDVKGDAAIAACTIAFQSNPDNARINYELGRAYDVAKKEQEKQFEYYQRASDKGYVIGIYNLARTYEREGPRKNQTMADNLHCKAAEAGFVLAMVSCGYAYDSGLGIAADTTKAMKWYKKGAESGDATAMADVGYMYEAGNGVPKDPVRAMFYYKQSAELGDTLGMNNYGNYLIQGIGAKQDIALGLDYLKKSIEAGGDDAPVSLAEAYDRGTEIPFDATKAAFNYLIALKLNGGQAKTVLIEKVGVGIKPETLNAIQAQLKAEGKVFEMSAGKLSPAVIAVLKDYPAK
jgi:TPR repeat protein